ncbi:MAG: hypothetical protein AAGE01_24610 [Pseudomonadota bacterium]
MPRKLLPCLLAALAINQPATANHDGNSEILDVVVVYGRSEEVIGTAAQASEGTVAFDDIRLPPMLRIGELAEAVPGLVATQHSGTACRSICARTVTARDTSTSTSSFPSWSSERPIAKDPTPFRPAISPPRAASRSTFTTGWTSRF